MAFPDFKLWDGERIAGYLEPTPEDLEKTIEELEECIDFMHEVSEDELRTILKVLKACTIK